MVREEETRNFWSRRRAAVRAEEEAEALRLQAREEAARQAELDATQAEKTDEELLKELGLPDPDSLGAGDDFSAFMRKAVPERLRRRALRRLWGSNPVLANLDGLTDYGEDYTDAATVVPHLKTAYQVGRGMYEHVRGLVEEEDAPRNEEAAKPSDREESVEAEGLRQPLAADEDIPVEEMESPKATADREWDDVPQAPRRHMRFAIRDDAERTGS